MMMPSGLLLFFFFDILIASGQQGLKSKNVPYHFKESQSTFLGLKKVRPDYDYFLPSLYTLIHISVSLWTNHICYPYYYLLRDDGDYNIQDRNSIVLNILIEMIYYLVY